MLSKNKSLLVFLGALSILPAVILGLLIIKYNVNVQFWDELDLGPYIYRYITNSKLTFQDYLAQHNESRLLFPKLIFIGLASLTRWDVRYEMLVTFLFACIISFNIYRLNNLLLAGGIFKILCVTALINLLIFSPVQYENWLWGIQMIVFIPILCITFSFVFAYSRINVTVKLIACICLSTVSTFSYANGMLCWVIVSPVLAFKNWQELLKKKWLINTWIGGFLLNIGIYFWNYRKPSYHPPFSYALLHPLATLEYFFSFLGAPFCVGKQDMAKFIGALLVIIFTAICAYLWKFRKDYILWNRMLCWIMMGMYTISSALITTFGRVGFGIEQSFSPRYTTFSMYLAISLIPLVIIVIDDIIAKRFLSRKKQAFLRFSILCLATYLLIMQIFSASNAIKLMAVWRTERLQGKSCLLFINAVEEKECLLKKIHPATLTQKPLITKLNTLGFIHPGLVKNRVIQNIESKEKVSVDDYGYGWLESIKKEKNNTYNAWGWARLPAREEPADVVVLTYEDPQKGDIAFALSYTRGERPDVVKATGKDGYLMSGWQKSFAASKLPKGEVKIKAWAFDSNTGKAFQLNGSQILPNP